MRPPDETSVEVKPRRPRSSVIAYMESGEELSVPEEYYSCALGRVNGDSLFIRPLNVSVLKHYDRQHTLHATWTYRRRTQR